jgi:transposase
MSISLLQHTQGIRGYQLLRNEYTSNTYTAHICKKSNKHQCSSCRSFDVTATLVGERIIKALPCGSKQTRINVKMHRLRCHDCKSFRMESIQFTSSAVSRVSRCLERTVLDLRKHMSIKAAANYFGLPWATVKNIEKRSLKKKYKCIKLRDVTAIGIDEVFMGKTLGYKGYLTIVRDLNSGAVLFVGQGKKGASLDGFAIKVKRSKANISAIAVDLAPSFTSWISKNFPKATIVYDHFHVIKLMNDKLNAIRRRIMRNLEENDKKELKSRRWHLVMNEENLTNNAAIELERCKCFFTELGTGHALKESLRRIYSIANCPYMASIAFKRWTELAEESKIPELVTMGKTIQRHIEGILAFWKTGGITSASMEGFNNKIGWLTRQAYGYRDEEYLILKIYDLPNLKTVTVL